MNIQYLREFAAGTITKETLDEMAKLEKWNMYGEDSKEISSLLKKAEKESDTKKAKELYNQALENAEKLKKKAHELPNDDGLDWAFNLLIKPWWWFIADIVSASMKGDSITAMSRSQAVSHYEALIRQIKSKISALK